MAGDIKGVTTTPLLDTKSGASDTTRISKNNSASNPNNPNSLNIENSSVSAADKLTLTSRAENLHMIETTINAQSDIDSERVASLKIAIDTGRYDVDPLRVAEKLIAFESQFVA